MQWNKQFQLTKEKIKESACKITAMEIYPSTAYVFFSMCLRKKVCFGCGIIELTPQKDQELTKTREPAILRKFGLGEKCPRKCLHSRRKALGVGLVKPNTTLEILALKSCLGYKRLNAKVGRIIKTNKQSQFLQS